MQHPHTLGPLHTRAKSRDHDIVRAQKKLSKGRPNTPPTSCSVVTNLQGKCEAIRDRTLNQMLIVILYSCMSSCMVKQNKPTVVNIQSAMVFRFCMRPTTKRWFLKVVQVIMKHDAIRCHA